uniref:Uncharacterized protein n=1 Tax=Zooxanthella nutricula TaxID=1333877 RepID=A0A7S2MNG5_9DINO
MRGGLRGSLRGVPVSICFHRNVMVAFWPKGGCRLALASEVSFMVLTFVIGMLYTYGLLMSYPLYVKLVTSKGQEAVRPAAAGVLLTIGKLASLVLHAAGSRLGGGLRWMQGMMLVLFAVSAAGLALAASPHVSGIAVLAGVSTLNLVSSRVLAGTLFLVPSEERTRRRTFIYDAACQAGCLWTSVVMALLQQPLVRSSWGLCVVVLNLPLVVTIVAWLCIQPGSFFSPSSMSTADIERESKVPALSSVSPRLGISRVCSSLVEDESIDSSTSMGASLASVLPGLGRARMCSASFDDESIDSSVATPAESAHTNLNTERGPPPCLVKKGSHCSTSSTLAGCWRSSPWANARVRVIAVTWWLNWWGFNFFTYSIFPTLIAERGPPLEMVGLMYIAEGFCATIFMSFLMPFLKTNLFKKFFGSVWVLIAIPVLAICTVGRVHWAGYFVSVLGLDIACAVNNITLGVVLLRCVPWRSIASFYAQAGAVGGFICALSYNQLSLHQVFGSWPLVVLVGHGVPMVGALLVYATHRQALADISALLEVPVQSPARALEGRAGEPLGDASPSTPSAALELSWSPPLSNDTLPALPGQADERSGF